MTAVCPWHYRTSDGSEVDCEGDPGHGGIHYCGRWGWKEGDRGAWQSPPAGHPHSGSDVTPNGSTREKWLQSRLQGGAGAKTRDAARRILATREQGTAARAELVEALHLMVDETERWKDAWSSEHVDKDRQVRAAMARSASCDAHGDEIKALAEQVTAFDEARDRAETARLVMLGWYQACVDFARIARQNQAAGKALPTPDAILSWMERQLPRTHAAHQKVWSRPTRTERQS